MLYLAHQPSLTVMYVTVIYFCHAQGPTMIRLYKLYRKHFKLITANRMEAQ